MGKIAIQTDHPVAHESLDHKYPAGALRNITSERFINKILSVRSVESVLDLGCAAGGFVKQWLDRGILAVGVEGTPHALVSYESVWKEIPDNLFLADITKPFQLMYEGESIEITTFPPFDAEPIYERWRPVYYPQLFDLITCSEVYEHIAEYDLQYAMANVDRHSKPDTSFVLTISNDASLSHGHDLHVTKRDREWWVDFFSQFGWVESDLQSQFSRSEFVWEGLYTMQFILERTKTQ